jgi:AraC-like DNA-binding protein
MPEQTSRRSVGTGSERAAALAWPDSTRARRALESLDFDAYAREIRGVARQIESLGSDLVSVAALVAFDELGALDHALALEDGVPKGSSRRRIWISSLGAATSIEEVGRLFLRHVDDLIAPFQRGQRAVNPIVLRARSFIDAHAHETVSLSRVAGELGVARNYLSALFKRENGITLTEYIHRVRVRRAEIILRSRELSLAETAYRVGYQSYRHFYRNFVRVCGCSPTAYVKEIAGSATDGDATQVDSPRLSPAPAAVPARPAAHHGASPAAE